MATTFLFPIPLRKKKKNSTFIIFHDNCYASLGFANILLCRALFPDTFYINCDGLEMTTPFRIFNFCQRQPLSFDDSVHMIFPFLS